MLRLKRTSLVLIAFLFAFSLKANAELINIDQLKTHWGQALGGAAATIVIHELGHFAVAEIEGADAYFDGITVKYRNLDNHQQQNLRLSSAGYQAQWLASEYALMRLNKNLLSPRQRAWNAGLVIGHIGITAAYLSFLKNHQDGDARGVAQSSGLSTDKVIALLAIPAVLDSWRLFGQNPPQWTSWTSRGFKGLGITAIWTF